MTKNQLINPIIHYLMISSLLIIFLTLLTNWFLWFYYYGIIKILLVNFTFKNFSIVILIFSGLAFFFATILLCNPKKNINNNIFSLVFFVSSLEVSEIIPGVDKTLYHKYYAGAWMYFSAFINNPSNTINNFRSYCWTIVQDKPLSKNGSYTIENLRAMNIGNALSKGENYPKWKTEISFYGNENMLKEQLWNE